MHSSVKTNRARPVQAGYRPAVTQWRLDGSAAIVLGTATALVVYDAWVSYQGFQQLGLGDHAPAVFAGLIFTTQMGVGLLHAVGEDFRSIKAHSDTQIIDSAWSWVLVIIYGVDIASNAVEFGFISKLASIRQTPVESLGSAALVLGMSVMLCFGDEILLRIYDKLSLAAKKNRLFSRRHGINVRAHQQHLYVLEDQAVQAASAAAGKDSAWSWGDGL